MTTTQARDLTKTDINRGREDERWLGWGYLGERDRATKTQAAEDQADRLVLRLANARGWDYETLFTWLNSKPGRWFGDIVFGGGSTADAEREFNRAADEMPTWDL